MNTEIKWLIVTVLFLGSVAPSLAVAERSEICGPMCHLPMAWHGGGGQMAWCAVGPKDGTFEQMTKRFAARRAHDAEWKQFQEALKLYPGMDRERAVLKAFRKFLTTHGGSARKAHDMFR